MRHRRLARFFSFSSQMAREEATVSALAQHSWCDNWQRQPGSAHHNVFFACEWRDGGSSLLGRRRRRSSSPERLALERESRCFFCRLHDPRSRSCLPQLSDKGVVRCATRTHNRAAHRGHATEAAVSSVEGAPAIGPMDAQGRQLRAAARIGLHRGRRDVAERAAVHARGGAPRDIVAEAARRWATRSSTART
jgi:hypothetical protein